MSKSGELRKDEPSALLVTFCTKRFKYDPRKATIESIAAQLLRPSSWSSLHPGLGSSYGERQQGNFTKSSSEDNHCTGTLIILFLVVEDDSATGFSWKVRKRCFSSKHEKATACGFSWSTYSGCLVHLPDVVFVWIRQLRFSLYNQYFFSILGNYTQEVRERY